MMNILTFLCIPAAKAFFNDYIEVTLLNNNMEHTKYIVYVHYARYYFDQTICKCVKLHIYHSFILLGSTKFSAKTFEQN